MCGITGFLGFPPEAAAGNVLRSMTAAIAHRGPDDEGYWLDVENEVALGHRRLSIVDLSPNGHQPMVSADGRYLVAFNGEVYNFMDVRAELEAVGSAPTWRGHSDTEVMLAAISVWGVERALQRFTGMFAFALWDRAERNLVLARDRFGEKPLYYGWAGSTFFFASELKALRRWPGWHPEIDRSAVALLRRYGYVPAPYSIYRRVFKLSPGAFVTVDLGDARRGPGANPRAPLPVRYYWSLRDMVRSSTGERFAGSEQEATNELEQLLRASIRRQMIADVPLGAFLSGGVDSSAVVALMQAQSSAPIRTFTIGFNEDAYDEAVHAKAVARHLGTDHTELYVTPSEAMSVIPKLPDLYDESFADSSQIPTHLVSRIARAKVTVSLSGDAGDELFGGYDRYFVGRRVWEGIGWMPLGVRRSIARLLTALSPDQWERIFARFGPYLPRAVHKPSPGDKLHKLAEILDVSGPQDFYRGFVSQWRNPTTLVLGSHEPPTIMNSPDQWPKLDDFIEAMMFLDSVSYLPDDILVKVDRAAMGVNLETRVPLLDQAIVEFAWRLPPALKVRNGVGKWLLRQVLYRYVPRELIDRPKMGFGVPIDSWLRGPLVEWAEALLNDDRLRREGFFDAPAIRRKWREHRSGERNWHYHLWNVLMFQAWLERHYGAPGN